MKVALVHDWLTGMRGGEKCLEEIAALFPGAPVYTLVHRRGSLSAPLESRRISTSWLQRLPRRERYYRWLLPLFPWTIERFDFSGFDLVVSSSHCVAKGVRTPPGTCHLCYCYTPMRYAWDQYRHYFGEHRLRWWNRRLIPPVMERLRRWDASTARRVDAFAAISRYVAGRIHRYYGREAAVIYPPVDLAGFHPAAGDGGYYLMVNALAPYKRVDLAVEAFNRLGRELRVVGTGQDERRLGRIAGGNVHFLGWLDHGALAEVYAGCRALVFPVEEDFGIAPLEALASGRPVIAFGRGGVTETVRPHPGHGGIGAGAAEGPPTGVFFTEQTPGALAEAVRFFERHEGDFDPAILRESVGECGPERFRREFAAFVETGLGRFREEGAK